MPSSVEKRWVCTSCGALWYNAPAGRCPSCNGNVEHRDVEYHDDGSYEVLPVKAKK